MAFAINRENFGIESGAARIESPTGGLSDAVRQNSIRVENGAMLSLQSETPELNQDCFE